MSLSKNKSEIINKIKLYASIANSQLDNNASSDFIFNTDDPIDFLFDIIKSSIGENILQSVVENALQKIITQKKLDELSDSVYDNIGKNLSEKSVIPSKIENNGITLPIKSIDTTDSLRKSNISGSSASKNNNYFFKKMTQEVLTDPYEDIVIPQIGPQTTPDENLKINYDEQKSEIKVKVPNNINQKKLFKIVRASIGVLFNAQIVITEIMNILFRNDLSPEDAKLLTLVRSYTTYDNKTVFNLDLKKLLDLELDAEQRGLIVSTSCYKENITVTEEQIDSVINNPTISSFNALVPNLNSETNSNAKNDYHKGLLKAILEALLSIILKQPGVLFMANIVKSIRNPDKPFSTDIEDILDEFKPMIETIFDDIYKDCFCIIFNYIKKYLIKLVVAVTIIFIKEQLEKRLKILTSLSGSEVNSRLNTL